MRNLGGLARVSILLLIVATLGAALMLARLSSSDRPGKGTAGSFGGLASSDVPTDHPPVANPAELDGARAESIYRAIVDTMIANYAVSGDPVVKGYKSWTRYNLAPYRSSNHGNLFVNVYANDIAHGHKLFGSSGPMPEGAQIVKDSFVVTRDGKILVGPFVLMEKLARGSSPATADWQYMMVGANGDIVGISGTLNAEQMRACHACHAKAPPGHDHLYPPPKMFFRSRL
jgi:hypothetical protein